MFDRLWKGHSGTEPVTARSDLKLRLLLARLFLPLFAVGTLLLWYWSAQSSPQSVPSEGSLRTLAVVCAALTVFALVDLLVVLHRRREERPPEHRQQPGQR